MTANFPRVSTGQTLADISAEAFNNMSVAAENAQRIVGGNGARVKRVGPHVTVLTMREQRRPSATLAVRRFTIVNRDIDGERIVDSTHGDNLDDGQTRDYLTCQPFDIAQSINYRSPLDIVQATKPVVKVWKPFGLRWIDYRNYIRVLKSDRIVEFTRVDEHTRIASFVDRPLVPTEEQVITPAYQPGIEIIAIKRSPLLTFPANNRPEDNRIEWMELNDGRWWANAFLGEIGGS